MESVHYKGFELTASPYQMEGSDDWSLGVWVRKHHELRQETPEKQFRSNEPHYPSEHDAEEESIRFGKRIIDGEIPKLTVGDLL